MGTDDYSSAIGGGLKLKGSKPAGVTKKKKKKKDKSKENSNRQPDAEDPRAVALQKALADEDRAANEEAGEEAEEEDYEPGSNKTETERKYEEMKRKRLDERLKKEGVKTHKQRVEELNKYLSTLSEHHDMPRIGPG